MIKYRKYTRHFEATGYYGTTLYTEPRRLTLDFYLGKKVYVFIWDRSL